MVCAGFALELYLKFFLLYAKVKAGVTVKSLDTGHKIDVLWRRMSQQHQELVACMHQNPTETPFVEGAAIRRQLLEERMAGIGVQPFVELRYIHELQSSTLLSHRNVDELVIAFEKAARYLLRNDDCRN